MLRYTQEETEEIVDILNSKLIALDEKLTEYRESGDPRPALQIVFEEDFLLNNGVIAQNFLKLTNVFLEESKEAFENTFFSNQQYEVKKVFGLGYMNGLFAGYFLKESMTEFMLQSVSETDD